MSEQGTEGETGSLNSGPLKVFTGLLGEDVFFVPCEWGTKKPLLTYVERPFEGTKSEAYRAIFDAEPTNVAVYLGKASGGLCAIDFNADEDLAAFLELNPALTATTATTRSRGSRGGMVWLRIEGGKKSDTSPQPSPQGGEGVYPESCNPEHKHFEWRADNRLSTIYGRHPKGMDYTLMVEAPPVTVAFDSIVWPEDWELPWDNAGDGKLKQLYGEPFYTNDKGALTGINEGYWAGLHAQENVLLFEKDEKTFYGYHGDTGLYDVESEDAIRIKISSRMLEASRQANVFDLQKKRTAKTLNSVIAHLRGIVEKHKPFTHYTVALLGCTDGDGNVFVVDEHAERLWLPQRHAAGIKAMLARHTVGVGKGQRPLALSDLKRFVAGADVFSKQSDGTTVAAQYARLGITLRVANSDRINGWAEMLHRLGDPDAGIRPTMFIHRRCGRLLECLPTLQHDPHRPEDVLKIDADEEGVGGDDAADCCRYLVATKARSVFLKKLCGL